MHERKCTNLRPTAKKRFEKRDANVRKLNAAKIARNNATAGDALREKRQELRDILNEMEPPHEHQQSPMPEFEHTEPAFAAPPHSPSPPPRPSGRPARKIRLPKRFRDELPPAPPYMPIQEDLEEEVRGAASASTETRSPEPENATQPVHPPFRTECDSYSVLREYAHGRPTLTPDSGQTLSDISDSPYLALDPLSAPRRSLFSVVGSSLRTLGAAAAKTAEDFFAPFKNVSIFRLMAWFYSSSNTKSIGELNSLVKQVILAPDFDKDHFVKFNAANEHARMDTFKETSNAVVTPFSFDDTWIKGTVKIPLPCDGVKHRSEQDAPHFTVEVHYRKPMDVIKAALAEPEAEKFHTTPFKAYWKSTPDTEERVYSEIYTADAWNDEYNKIYEANQMGPNSHLESLLIGLMIWSDSTSLAQFGTADLWPIYLYIGNQSKYARAKPSSFSAHHIAYMPKAATAAMLTHLRRELAHAVWMLLLDDEFMHAYIHGFLFQLIDGILRLLFPRFLTYSADYPEKVLMACLKFLSQCPCPRCLILKSKIPRLGSKSDKRDRERLLRVDDATRRNSIERARKLMFVKGVSVTSVHIERILGAKSLIPTRNAFSERLFEHGFNFYQMFTPDLLHEFELGVWKAVFTHLIRILYAHGDNTIQELNSRYRQVPTFGRDTIRKFSNNASGMKKLAARDYEDLLQCAIPVFEGLLPLQQDRVVRKLLFELATWHGLAKLRLHTETTVRDLENSTTRLGDLLRLFQEEVCSQHKTYDLPTEEAARGRRKTAAAAKKATTATRPAAGKTAAQAKPKTPRRERLFTLGTYKVHALGGYGKAIRLYGTTDNYTSQTGELEHRRGKRFYRRVHKGKHVLGIALQVRRERLIHRVLERKRKREEGLTGEKSASPEERLPPTSPERHHHISVDKRQKVHLPTWLGQYAGDPALVDFILRLKNHLLSRLLNCAYDGDEHPFSAQDRREVIIENNTIYRHKVLRINYTTYDIRRDQDSLNPRTHADIMVLSPENEEENENPHPYWYARILGIFHVDVRYRGPCSTSREPKRMEFLFVRWFGRDFTPRPGWKTKRLLRLGFVPGNSEMAFGFLDPSQVIRAVHLIPAFAWGKVTKYLGRSVIARSVTDPIEDWQLYYVSIFSDRDLMMRFRGGGVGHNSTRHATDFFKKDWDRLDLMCGDGEAADEDEDEDEDEEEEEEEVEVEVDNDEDGEEERRNREDYGYTQDYDPDEIPDEEEEETEEDVHLGTEEDGGGVDPDMEELGYSEL
ncbi:hypothetical protein NLJ89_g10856 [Agrocybe chaxingu]|uniref:Uncharacterized protein n=1 Tax=Agrocybe chaxingu TaxID=84603 RepID=A0A9W8MQI1_9AGAR|nr:hypothetical protein NLJ89_g10856 [Agrocybe chaxingu]